MTMFFLIPKNVTSERPLALMPTLIRWWEAMRASEVMKWQQRYRIEWDAFGGRNGGAQRTAWERLMGHGKVQISSGRRRFGSGGPGSEPGGGTRAGRSPCGVGLGDALQLPEEGLAGAVWVFRASEAGALRTMCGGALPDYHGHFARVQVELFASVDCIAGCFE